MPLRPLTEEDRSLVRTWRNAPQVRLSMYSTHEITEAEHLAWFARMKNDPLSRWFIHEDVIGTPDGVVYFTQYKPENRSAFWGFYLGTGVARGIGTKLGLDALDQAFSLMNIHKLNAEVIATNERSLHFHNKLGFQQEGCFRDFHFDGKNYVDVLRFGILDKEWAIHRSEVIRKISEREGTAQQIDKSVE